MKVGNKTTSIQIPKIYGKLKDYYIGGLYDAEGWVQVDKTKYFRIGIKMKSKSIIYFVNKRLVEMGFFPRCYKKDNCFEVDMNKQNEIKLFVRKIKLFHPKWLLVMTSINGGRREYPRLHAAYNG